MKGMTRATRSQVCQAKSLGSSRWGRVSSSLVSAKSITPVVGLPTETTGVSAQASVDLAQMTLHIGKPVSAGELHITTLTLSWRVSLLRSRGGI